MEALKQSLAADRKVTAYLQGHLRATAIPVPRVVLEDISNKLSHALDALESSVGDKSAAELRFEVDDLKAWETFTFWAIKGQLPSAADISPELPLQCSVWVHAWLFGDTYNIPAFKDLVMLELLKWCEGSQFDLSLAERAFNKIKSGAHLRMLILEEIVWMLEDTYAIGWSDLQSLWSTPGFSDELFEEQKRYGREGYATERFKKGNGELFAPWKKFMVGDGPSKHWAFGDTMA